MASSKRPSIDKRNREQALRERNAAKQERRAKRSAERKTREDAPPGEDPDIASIVPGPQRPIWED